METEDKILLYLKLSFYLIQLTRNNKNWQINRKIKHYTTVYDVYLSDNIDVQSDVITIMKQYHVLVKHHALTLYHLEDRVKATRSSTLPQESVLPQKNIMFQNIKDASGVIS